MEGEEIPNVNKSVIVWVKTSFRAFHRWEHAPPDVDFLCYWHRHVFHVQVCVSVTDMDREVEFFTLQKKMDEFLALMYEGKRVPDSCETMASRLCNAVAHWGYKVTQVTISEDNENGATVFTAEVAGEGGKLVMDEIRALRAQCKSLEMTIEALRKELKPIGITI